MIELSRYRVVRKLAQGGMAEVYLAQDASFDAVRLVVIKQIHPSIVADERIAAMFRNEARIAMQLGHANIAHVYEVAQRPSGQLSLVMEFIHGVDLEDILAIETVRMAPALAVFIAAQVAAALHHAHTLTTVEGKRLQVVHRDISPQNIRISHDGTVKVLDFGIAKVAGSFISQRGVTKGKFGYMAPEQMVGDPVDARTDLFALGIVLYEMLTYRKLFRREDARETLSAIQTGEIIAPSKTGAGRQTRHADALDRIVIKALASDPERRYQSARELQADLEEVLRQDSATSSDLEQLMTNLFGDGPTRLAQLIGRDVGRGPTTKEVTSPTIPARPLPDSAADSGSELGDDDLYPDDKPTAVGYQPLGSDTDRD